MLGKHGSLTSQARADFSTSIENVGSVGGAAVHVQQALLSHLDSAYTLARYLTRQGEAAEELVQEAFLKASRGIDGRPGENSRAWLLSIVRNCFFSLQKRDEAASATGSDGSLAEALAAGYTAMGELSELPSSLHAFIDDNGDLAVRLLIEQLPHRFREIVVLRDVEHMSYRDISRITGVPVGTVMARLARARKMLTFSWKAIAMKSKKEIVR